MEEEEAKKREREREIRQLTRTKGTERVGTGADKKEHSNKKRKKLMEERIHISNLSLTTNPHRGNSVLGRAQQGGLQKLRHRTHNRLQVNKVDSLESLKKKKNKAPQQSAGFLSCLV